MSSYNPVHNNEEAGALSMGAAEDHVAMSPVLQRSSSSSNRGAWIALACIAVVAATAFGVAVSAHTRSMTVASTGTELQGNLGNTAASVAKTEVQAKANFKTQFAGMMLMNQPACRQTHAGYVICLDLVNTASKLITDLTDPEVNTEKILANIDAGDYNTGSAVAFATLRDDAVAAMAPALAEVIEDSNNYLTVDGIADMSKCDYVWRGVACLTLIQSAESKSCSDEEDNTPCAKKIVPVIHILDDADVEYNKDGSVRRRDAKQVIGAVAGGITGAIGGGLGGAKAGGAIGGPKGAIVGGALGGIGGAIQGGYSGWQQGSSLDSWKR